MKFLIIFLIMIILTGAMVGFYYYSQEYKPAIERYNSLLNENKTLAEYLSQLRKEMSNEPIEESPVKDTLFNQFENTQATEVYQSHVSGIRLTLPVADLFAPGDYKLKSKGKGMIKKIAQIISRLDNDAEIIVEGHTDNEKMGPNLRKKIPSNWELSALRAINVVKYLQDSLKIDPSKLSAVAYGESRPIADNSTEEGRKKNRRIEIFIKYKNTVPNTPQVENNEEQTDTLNVKQDSTITDTVNNE